MLEQIKPTMLNVLEQDEFFELAAKIMKKSLDAYVREGFSRDEAMLLLARQGSLVKGSR